MASHRTVSRRGRRALVRRAADPGSAVARVKPGAAFGVVKSGAIPLMKDFYEHMARASYGVFCDVINPRRPLDLQVAATAVRASLAVRGHLDGYFRGRKWA